ncbi:Molecular chaperone (DnaJ superfamily) domain-containing protein [Dioscorea alata]|uniref:Molecular chaperone (DnaJ superfamily) domain-containing protein n=6 Tax=Dioscorea alata TaxID=55571 RepID=A0ACB7WP44_DIOAL|nr:Molecular chaperone (DnaJ superfamily) domain-containing protein [Dioscorea alata]KAH7689989.1 Molecular chaperone (DnaJ superfamily) domain-containing protein [Dioscorea alata]KAH7689990.1 Molecular chaperone (DnaJ superfamily) domain-containing protein [Dioscorea alata]KAH7689991.1 Molecular chaperone (DnaJ superfamily) domain-containing protein [Dioscorea alata]KAH7689992.1 Molecular chaperone (DnaJ superfamily) domain-containing protein [Dioscorea alata]
MAKAVDSEEFVDHYLMLCLPSGEKGSKLSLNQIEKAYRKQSLKRHPDKRPNDPDATADFQCLTISYETLRDISSRAIFDSRLHSMREKAFQASFCYDKRRKLSFDLKERERAAAASELDPASRKEKMVAAELQQELAAFQSRKAKKIGYASTPLMSQQEKAKENVGASSDEKKVLKVSWERDGRDYDAVQLTKLFERFGRVEDVVIKSKKSKKKGSAIVVMSSKVAAVAATQSMIGDISNPLLVLPLQASSSTSTKFPTRLPKPFDPKLNNIIGAGFQDYEASVLKKLEKVKEKDRVS